MTRIALALLVVGFMGSLSSAQNPAVGQLPLPGDLYGYSPLVRTIDPFPTRTSGYALSIFMPHVGGKRVYPPDCDLSASADRRHGAEPGGGADCARARGRGAGGNAASGAGLAPLPTVTRRTALLGRPPWSPPHPISFRNSLTYCGTATFGSSACLVFQRDVAVEVRVLQDLDHAAEVGLLPSCRPGDTSVFTCATTP